MRPPTGDDPIVVSVIGTGVVGGRTVRHIVSGLTAGRVMIHDIRPDAAQAVARASGARAVVGELDQALDAPVVVVMTPSPQLEIATEALGRGAHVVTTTDAIDDVNQLMQLQSRAHAAGRTLVLCANLAPGLAGLLARMLADRLDEADEIHVAVHGTAGPACARQHHRALGGIGLGWHDGGWIERQAGSGRELCWFPDPVGPQDCYRSEMVDPYVLHAVFPEVQRISARMSATRRDRLTARLPMLRSPHQEGTMGALRVEVRGWHSGGREALVLGVAERPGTASAIVAGAAALALHHGTIAVRGVVALGDARLPTELLVDRLRDAGIAVDEFVGTGATGSTW
jgi:predicted dinucleotide-binding enzyme